MPMVLSVAMDHVRKYSRAERLHIDPVQARLCGKAFSECADRWLAKHKDKTTIDLQATLGLDRTPYFGLRNGDTVPHISSLRKMLRKMGMTPDEARPLVDAVFKARKLGAYEPVEKVVADMPDISDSGTLLKRLRLANLMSMGEMCEAIGNTNANSWWIYEEKGTAYHQHATAIAAILVPKEAIGNFREAVRRTHGLPSVGQIFNKIGQYKSFPQLLADLAESRCTSLKDILGAAGFQPHDDLETPSKENIARIAKAFDLSPKQASLIEMYVQHQRDGHSRPQSRYVRQQETRARNLQEARARNLPIFFKSLSQPEHFGKMMRDLRNFCGLSLREVAERQWMEPCAVRTIETLELQKYAPEPARLASWMAALRLDETQSQALEAIAATMRPAPPPKKYPFGDMLAAVMTARNMDSKTLAMKVNDKRVIDTLLINTLLTGERDATQTVIEDITHNGLGFESPDQFAKAAAALLEKPRPTATHENFSDLLRAYMSAKDIMNKQIILDSQMTGYGIGATMLAGYRTGKARAITQEGIKRIVVHSLGFPSPEAFYDAARPLVEISAETKGRTR